MATPPPSVREVGPQPLARGGILLGRGTEAAAFNAAAAAKIPEQGWAKLVPCSVPDCHVL